MKRLLTLLLSAVALVGCVRSVDVTDDPGAAYAGSRLQGHAPQIALVNQRGEATALSDFRGKVVGLTFMDSRCRDVCPLTSAEIIRTWLALTTEERLWVAFLGVNVNSEANDVADVAAASRDWRLGEIPAWHFLTGPEENLRGVWGAFPIEVQPDPSGEAISHTSGVFLIDAAGELRWYVSVPLEDPGWDGPRLAEILLGRLRELIAEAGQAAASR